MAITKLWLATKRFLRVGWFTTIVYDKCDSHWTDVECPNPSVMATYHRGQFGHRVRFEYCAACYERRKQWEASDESTLLEAIFGDSSREIDPTFSPKGK
jgi:hypothetical protein